MRYVCKETNRWWEQGEDPSLVSFTPVEYLPTNRYDETDEPIRCRIPRDLDLEEEIHMEEREP